MIILLAFFPIFIHFLVAAFEWILTWPIREIFFNTRWANFFVQLPPIIIFPKDVMALSVFPQHCDPLAEWRAYFETLADRLHSALIPIFLLASALCTFPF